MFKVALIQNDSEMLRYSWADVSSLLEKFNYEIDNYTIDNIDIFFNNKIHRYDSIIIASNAFNNPLLHNKFIEHKELIIQFLESGKGMLISLQMKLADKDSYAFLPSHLDLKVINRLRHNEKANDGNINFNPHLLNHPIFNYPNTIEETEVKKQCLNNKCALGYYWTYLMGDNIMNYQSLITDDSEDRQLLLVTPPNEKFRLAITSLALDWQNINDLYSNTVKYIVEGRPKVAFISKLGTPSFSYNYLKSSIKNQNISFHDYIDPSLQTFKIHKIHRVAYVDPQFTETQFEEILSSHIERIIVGELSIFRPNNKFLGSIEIYSNYREFNEISFNSTNWLIQSFHETVSGYWRESFWYSLDAVAALATMNVSIKQFIDPIMNEIEKHNVDGSYDEVIGASCAKIELLSYFFHRRDNRIKKTKDWILKNLKNKDNFEISTAIDILIRYSYMKTNNSIIRDFIEFIENQFDNITNEFQIYRYCSTLITIKKNNLAHKLALKLLPKQSKDGSWTNIPQTASIALMLMKLKNEHNTGMKDIDDMIFKAIQYIKSRYDKLNHNWKNDITATSKCLRALKVFEDNLEDSPDSTLNQFKYTLKNQGEVANFDLNKNYSRYLGKQVNTLKETIADQRELIEKEQRSNVVLKKLSLILTFISLPIIVFFALLINDLVHKNKLIEVWDNYIESWLSTSLSLIFYGILLVLIIIYVIFTAKVGIYPKWVKSIIKPIIAFFGIGERLKIDK